MKRICKFSVHDYMDMYPVDKFYIFEGETLSDIEDNARKFEKHMSETYSGGTTTFVKVFSKEEARSWYDNEIKLIKSGNFNQEEKDKYVDELEQEFHDIYD